ncbi:hypothetical protein HNQ94_003838 [Salirhabdus euzebyi]|uniref:VOC domain-containing protein n=1 Tax=Salirhabdus euzebyi TaxID=394506 RepID=A0A841QA84_9BACI|nr:VOC family protein [Salirhabdus euzebyi]MBB6455338.1 hypothetical protein [Salirhabdus euzebyi]
MGRVIGFELNSQDPKKASAFYAKVFGWQVSSQQWDYYPVKTGKGEQLGIDGGIAKGPGDFPHGSRIQIEVDCIDESIRSAKDNGAMVIREKMEFESFYLAYLVDPTGLGFGLVQQK